MKPIAARVGRGPATDWGLFASFCSERQLAGSETNPMRAGTEGWVGPVTDRAFFWVSIGWAGRILEDEANCGRGSGVGPVTDWGIFRVFGLAGAGTGGRAVSGRRDRFAIFSRFRLGGRGGFSETKPIRAGVR